MIMKSIKDAKQLSGKLTDILTDLASRLKRGWKGDPWQLKSIKIPKYLAQFEMSRSSGDVKVDLLPRFKANVEGTNAGTYLITSRLVALLIIKFVSTWVSSQAIDNSTKLHSQGFTHFKEKKLGKHLAQFLTPESYMRGMRLSFRRNYFCDRLGGQGLVMMADGIQSRQPLTNHNKRFSTQTIPEIVV